MRDADLPVRKQSIDHWIRQPFGSWYRGVIDILHQHVETMTNGSNKRGRFSGQHRTGNLRTSSTPTSIFCGVLSLHVLSG